MATKHSETHAGLQQHSIGGSYPWSIVGVGDQWQAWNLLDENQRGPLRRFYGQAQNDIPEPYLAKLVKEEREANRLRERRDIIAAVDRGIFKRDLASFDTVANY